MRANYELLQRVVEMFGTGQTDAAADVFGPDYTDHQRPESLDLVGPAEFQAIVAGARRAMPNLEVSVVGEVIADGDYIATRLNWSSDNVDRETLEILRVENGKFVEHWGAQAWSRTR